MIDTFVIGLGFCCSVLCNHSDFSLISLIPDLAKDLSLTLPA